MQELTYTAAYRFYAHTESNYFNLKERFIRTFIKQLEQRIPQTLNVKVKEIEFDPEDRPIIHLVGNDLDEIEFASNILAEYTGKLIKASELKGGMKLLGILHDVHKYGFGLFADGGIVKPAKDVLIPLYYLRKTLVNGKKLSLNRIADLYAFMDHLQVEIEITDIKNNGPEKDENEDLSDKVNLEKGIDGRENRQDGSSNTQGGYSSSLIAESKNGLKSIKIEGRFSQATLERYRSWVDEGLDLIVATGISRQKLKKTIAKRGHTQDIIEVRRLGPLENVIVCKRGTNAPGIIANIGKFIPFCEMKAFIPSEIKNIIR